MQHATGAMLVDRLKAEAIKEQTDLLQYWLDRWANSMTCGVAAAVAELNSVGHSFEGDHSISNYMTAEEDGLNADDRRDSGTVQDIGHLIDELNRVMPWTRWAIWNHYGLQRFNVWRFKQLDPVEAYINAREELRLMVVKAGMTL
jgi:hypothetical protein